MPTVKHVRSLTYPGFPQVASPIELTVEGYEVFGPISIANGQTDKEVSASIDFSQLSSFFIMSTVNMLFETNDGSSPADTWSLLANKLYFWITGDYDACLITEDVTKFLLTNASGSTGLLYWGKAYADATP